MVLVELHRESRRDEQLRQIHPDVAAAHRAPYGAVRGVKADDRGRVQLAVIGRHAPIAIHGNTDRHVATDHPVVAELGDQVVFLVVAVEGPQAADARLPLRPEVVDPDVPAAADQHHVGRVGCGGQGVLAVGDAHARHALGLDAVAVREVSVGCECGGRKACDGQKCCDLLDMHGLPLMGGCSDDWVNKPANGGEMP